MRQGINWGKVICWETQDSLKACFVSKVFLEHLLTKIILSITSSNAKWVNMGNCLSYDKNIHTSYTYNNACSTKCMDISLYLMHWMLQFQSSLSWKMDTTLEQRWNRLLFVEKFDSKLKIFYAWMVIEAMNVLQPFLPFASIFEGDKTHNMLILMLDSRYKNLQCITNFV